MTIKNQIIQGLLHNSKMKTAEIADYCGYQKAANKYGIVDKMLKELVEDDLLERNFSSHEKGRPASVYQLKKDLGTILKIYQNFDELRDDIRSQDWIVDLVMSKKLVIENFELKVEIRQMLKHSPTFFYLSLIHPSIIDLADYWFTVTRRNNFNLNSRENSTDEMIDSPFKYHEFFTFCVFSDGLNGINIDQSLIYLDTIVKKLRETDHSVGNFSMSTIMMSLKKVCDLIENDDSKTISWLTSQINLYEVKKQAWEDLIAENKQDLETYYEMVAIYNEVFEKLRLGKG